MCMCGGWWGGGNAGRVCMFCMEADLLEWVRDVGEVCS